MSTVLLLVLAVGVAFAVAVSIRVHSELDSALGELSKLGAKVAASEADLSTLIRRVETIRMELAEGDRLLPSPAAAEAEALRADPRVYVQRVPDQPNDRVILSNRSAAVARHLILQLSCPGGVTPFLPEFAERNFPVDILQQGVPYIVLASFRGRCWPPVDARLEWRDPDGSLQVREFPLHW